MSDPCIEEEMAAVRETAYDKLSKWLKREPTEEEVEIEVEYTLDHYKYKY